MSQPRCNESSLQRFRGRDREHQLLLHCARTVVAAEGISAAAALLDAGIDWAYFLACGSRHRVLPLIHGSLKRHFAEQVPREILASLDAHFYANLTASVIQSRALFGITTLLGDSSIPVLAFKGPTLAALAYGDMALRQAGDLDLLVPRNHIHEVARLLHSLDYQSYVPLPAAREADYLRHHHAHHFLAKDPRVSLDIHWSLMPPYFSFAMDPSELMRQGTTVTLDGEAIPTLRPEDLLLFLCLHGAKHRWESLVWICDLHELMASQPTMDWEQVARDARRYGLERTLACGLELVRLLFDAKLPVEVMRRLPGDRVPLQLALQVRGELFGEAGNGQGKTPWPVNWFFLKSMSRWRDRLLTSAQYVMIPSCCEFQAIRVPAALFFLYYLFRPLRLTLKYTGALLR